MGERASGYSSGHARALIAQAISDLKVFPLSGVVILPGMATPLHVFEPRYVALTQDALATDRLITVASLMNPEDAMLERAPIHAVAGTCLIQEEERSSDGHYNILLRGLGRVRLLDELETGKPYREFNAQILDDVYPAGGPATLELGVDALEQCVYDLAALLPSESGAPQLAEAAAHVREPSRLADMVASAVVSEPATRQKLLEEVNVERRLEMVTSEVASIILMLTQGRIPRA